MEGIWWLQAPSKFTRKDTYYEILKFFASRGAPILLYTDDEARGHGGVFPENFLATLTNPCTRVQHFYCFGTFFKRKTVLYACRVCALRKSKPQTDHRPTKYLQKVSTIPTSSYVCGFKVPSLKIRCEKQCDASELGNF